MSEIKTSKVKEVVSAKPYGTANYCNLVMENGDKINVGLPPDLEDGCTIKYEIKEHGQQEFNKASCDWKNGIIRPSKGKGNFSPSNGSKSYQRNQASIIAQYAFREANLMLISNGYGEDVNTTSQRLDKTTALAELILDKLVVLEQKAKDNGLG
jgi:hypothetical protein